MNNAKRYKARHVLRLAQNDGSQGHVVGNTLVPNRYTHVLSSGLERNSDGGRYSPVLEGNNNEIQDEDDEIENFHHFFFLFFKAV